MSAHNASRLLLLATLCVAALAANSSAVRAQTSALPQKYDATAINMGSGPTGMTRVLITVDRWSTEAERGKLLKTLMEKGPRTARRPADNRSRPAISAVRIRSGNLRYASSRSRPKAVVASSSRPIAR